MKVAVIGATIMDVVSYVDKAPEYGVDVLLTMLPFEVARWLKFEGGEKITPATLRGANRGMFVTDRVENPVLLVENEWALGWIRENNSKLIMSATPFES